MRQLISSAEAIPCATQPKKPCSDCPFSRSALRGWLGAIKVEDWIRAAHGESVIDCHALIGPQCAGAAIYRANVCKIPRAANQLRLKPNSTLVFSNPGEFIAHHSAQKEK